MFDVTKVADKIRNARINKNMTQTELADKMGVSFQAVSNWERACSMPDLSKLGDLCRVLGLSLEDLLSDDREAMETVKKVMDGDEVTPREAAEIAPIIPPRELARTISKNIAYKTTMKNTLRDALKGRNDGVPPADPDEVGSRGESGGEIGVEELMGLAPFFSSDELGKLVDRATIPEDFDIYMVHAFAPFLRSDKLAELVDRARIPEDFDIYEVMGLAPFLRSDKVADLADRATIPNDFSLYELCGLAPFLPAPKLAELVDRVNIPDDYSVAEASALAPFLPSYKFGELIDRICGRN